MTICERNTGGRILCIRLSGLGDIAHALNALSLLRQERPDAHIAWLVEDRFSGLLRRHPHIDELITVPRAIWGKMVKTPFRWLALGAELKEMAHLLRQREFDISVDFQSSIKSAWLVAAAGAGMRVGFGGGVNREFNRLVQNHLVSVPTAGAHRIERDLALLAPLGIATRYADPVVPRRERDARRLDEALEGRLSGGPLVVIHPGTSKFAAFKRWLPERYARVADRLVAERGADVLVTYGPADRELAEQVVASMRRPGSLAPRTERVGQLIHLLRRADLFVGSDTGPMHIASALGVPVVALFGPKDPVQTGPYCSRSVVVTGSAACRPCSRRWCRHVRCMTSITVRQVLGAALDVLDGGGERRAREGPIRQPFTYRFRLGKWRGRIATCYSAPEFYTRLCYPDDFMRGSGVELVKRSRHRTVVSVPARVAGASDRFIAKRYRPRSRLPQVVATVLCGSEAKQSWNCATAARARGAAVPFHVCHMERGPRWHRDQFLLAEELLGAVTLRYRLSEMDGAGHFGAASAEQDALIRATADAVRSFHRAAYLHLGLTDENVLVCADRDTEEPEVSLVGLGRARWVGWLPGVVRQMLAGLDLATLASSLAGSASPSAADRFLDVYLGDLTAAPRRRRLLSSWVSFLRRRTEGPGGAERAGE